MTTAHPSTAPSLVASFATRIGLTSIALRLSTMDVSKPEAIPTNQEIRQELLAQIEALEAALEGITLKLSFVYPMGGDTPEYAQITGRRVEIQKDLGELRSLLYGIDRLHALATLYAGLKAGATITAVVEMTQKAKTICAELDGRFPAA